MTASDGLTRALIAVAASGGSVPCGEYGGHLMWTSDDSDERALAASWCTGCPVFSACGEAADANDERFGVWAGVDRSATTRGKRP